MATEIRNKRFTVSWRLENYKYLLPKTLYSPWFTVETLEWTQWKFAFFPDSKEDIAKSCFYLLRSSDCNFSGEIELNYRFTVFSDLPSLQPFEVSCHDKFKKGSWSSAHHIPKAKIYQQKDGYCVLPNVLTIKCIIWKKEGSMLKDGKCTVITETQVERTSFVGVLENFSNLGPDDEYMPIKPMSDSGSMFPMNILLSFNGNIFIEIIPLSYEKMQLCHCMLYLLDSTGNEIKCGDEWFAVLGPILLEPWRIVLSISKRNLLDRYTHCLMNDCLTLKCQIVFSTGTIISKIAETKCSDTLSEDIEHSDSDIEEDDQVKSSLKDDLKCLLLTGVLSDTKIKTATETFSTHKLVLSARSPVFKAMFTNDMKEKIENCVQIEDLEADTVRHLLLFLYSDTLEDLSFESAMKLYFAADKYEVRALKHKCSSFLKENIHSSNCCEVLLLADKHNDSVLKKAAQDYIVQHSKDILQMDQWKCLEENNLRLCYEILRVKFQRNRKSS